MKPSAPRERLEQLDSLRGLAALSVAFGHCLMLVPAWYVASSGWVHALEHSPLAFVIDGTSAVNLFFVLSGFVLCLPFLSRPVPYRGYLIKRVLRIYPPYLATVALAVLLRALLYRGDLPGYSEWFAHVWAIPPSVGDVAAHASLVGDFKTGQLVPVFWSLVHEMRVSIVFPLIAVFVARSGTMRAAVVGVGISILATGAMIASRGHAPWLETWADTCRYVPLFMLGVWIAKHRAPLSERVRALPSSGRIALLIVALLAYTFNVWGPEMRVSLFVMSPVSGLASGVFVVLSLSSDRFVRILHLRWIVAMGRASYSLYLVHALVLISCVHALHGTIPLPAIIVLAAALVFCLTGLMYRFVEVPTMTLGRKLGTPKVAVVESVPVPPPPVGAGRE